MLPENENLQKKNPYVDWFLEIIAQVGLGASLIYHRKPSLTA